MFTYRRVALLHYVCSEWRLEKLKATPDGFHTGISMKVGKPSSLPLNRRFLMSGSIFLKSEHKTSKQQSHQHAVMNAQPP